MEFIRNVVDQSTREIFKSNFKLKTYQFDDVIYRAGDPVRYIYFIKSGSVEVIRLLSNNRFRRRQRSRLRTRTSAFSESSRTR